MVHNRVFVPTCKNRSGKFFAALDRVGRCHGAVATIVANEAIEKLIKIFSDHDAASPTIVL